jgi:ABC-type multidrug transport system fused ATPase/permease subunit
MFSNSVRYNLDPFGASTDLELWTVLGKVQLAEVIAALPKGLDQEVAEGGENFSQGQRQLLCIARSLLRNPKVLIMDEATASIDNETDALIQTMYVPSSYCASFCIVVVDTVMSNNIFVLVCLSFISGECRIRENFANATILTIAHRLNTIMDSDRVLVLDDGRIAEFDTPSVLLSKKDSQFKQMVDQSHAAHGESAM